MKTGGAHPDDEHSVRDAALLLDEASEDPQVDGSGAETLQLSLQSAPALIRPQMYERTTGGQRRSTLKGGTPPAELVHSS